MLDIETLGTKPGCVVLSIGACIFDRLGTAGTFYKTLPIQEQLDKGLKIEEGTLLWWLKQDKDTRDEAFKGTRFGVADVLREFNTFCLDVDTVWGNGSNFDQPILKAVYDKAESRWPFKFYKELCFRTLKHSVPQIEMERNDKAHNALADAFWQAKYAVYCLQYLHEKGLDL